jgi:hypothetical protein
MDHSLFATAMDFSAYQQVPYKQSNYTFVRSVYKSVEPLLARMQRPRSN